VVVAHPLPQRSDPRESRASRASEPRERSGERGVPASERPPSREALRRDLAVALAEAGVGGSGGAKPPGVK
jgi:hypothetical protein